MLPFLSPGDLPDTEIEPTSSVLAGRFFIIEPPGKPLSLSFLTYKRRVIIYFQKDKMKLGNKMCEMLSIVSGTR